MRRKSSLIKTHTNGYGHHLKTGQIDNLRDFQKRNAAKAQETLEKLQQIAVSGGNVFEQMMETARFASLGQITGALYRVGGKYRRNM